MKQIEQRQFATEPLKLACLGQLPQRQGPRPKSELLVAQALHIVTDVSRTNWVEPPPRLARRDLWSVSCNVRQLKTGLSFGRAFGILFRTWLKNKPEDLTEQCNGIQLFGLIWGTDCTVQVKWTESVTWRTALCKSAFFSSQAWESRLSCKVTSVPPAPARSEVRRQIPGGSFPDPHTVAFGPHPQLLSCPTAAWPSRLCTWRWLGSVSHPSGPRPFSSITWNNDKTYIRTWELEENLGAAWL